MITALTWAGVAVAGGAGALLRHLVAHEVTRRLGTGFPWGIWSVNLSGSLVLGLLSGLALPHDAALVVGTGLVGAYTTFSTWMLQTRELVAHGRSRVAVGYAAASVGGGLLLAWAGLTLTG